MKKIAAIFGLLAVTVSLWAANELIFLDTRIDQATYARFPSESVYNLDAVTTATNITIPSTAQYVIINSTGDFWCRYNAVAAVPSAEVLDGTGSILNPTSFALVVGTTNILSFAADSAVDISLEWYAQ